MSIQSTGLGHDERPGSARAKAKKPLQHEALEPRIWVRPKEACRIGGFGLTQCYELMNVGTLESRKVGRMRLISVQSIEKLGQRDQNEAA